MGSGEVLRRLEHLTVSSLTAMMAMSCLRRRDVGMRMPGAPWTSLLTSAVFPSLIFDNATA